MTAVQMQCEFAEQARKFVEDRWGSDVDDQTADVLDRWQDVLDRLESEPMSLSGELDWVAKLSILNGYRERDGLDWDHARLQLVDLQYSDVRPDKGLANRLEDRGALARLTTEPAVRDAMVRPPTDTRAYFRGECLRRFPDDVAAASWDAVIFDVHDRDALQRVPTLDPMRGTREHVGALLERCASAAELVDGLKEH
jgi:proteasome accessory factor A